MAWNKRPQVQRPEYPKLVGIGATTEQVQDLLPHLLQSDPDAALVDGGAHGVYARVHNEAAEKAARMYGEGRGLPLS